MFVIFRQLARDPMLDNSSAFSIIRISEISGVIISPSKSQY